MSLHLLRQQAGQLSKARLVELAVEELALFELEDVGAIGANLREDADFEEEHIGLDDLHATAAAACWRRLTVEA